MNDNAPDNFPGGILVDLLKTQDEHLRIAHKLIPPSVRSWDRIGGAASATTEAVHGFRGIWVMDRASFVLLFHWAQILNAPGG